MGIPMSDITYRLAKKSDVPAILWLYHKSRGTSAPEEFFLNADAMESGIVADDGAWLIAERGGRAIAFISAQIDREQGLCKIMRLAVDTEEPDRRDILRGALRRFLTHVETEIGGIDIVYTTTLSLSLTEQEITLLEGFKIMGVFPNALGADHSQINGLTVRFSENVLEQKRYRDFALHRLIAPFFAICRGQIGIPELPEIAPESLPAASGYESMPPLEIVRAPLLIENKFKKLRERRSQVVNFYPFYRPDTLVCDPEQKIEIFIKADPTQRFAAIIGERLERSVHPVSLYNEVLKLLRANGITYVEIINDAADAFGIQCILDAGFTPCAYVPAFKRQGETRRDYVVFSKSFEYLCRPGPGLNPIYLDFFERYFALERRNY